MGGRWEEQGREGGRGEEEGGAGGEVGGRWGGDVFAWISHESCGVCLRRVSLCYSIKASPQVPLQNTAPSADRAFGNHRVECTPRGCFIP